MFQFNFVNTFATRQRMLVIMLDLTDTIMCFLNCCFTNILMFHDIKAVILLMCISSIIIISIEIIVRCWGSVYDFSFVNLILIDFFYILQNTNKLCLLLLYFD